MELENTRELPVHGSASPSDEKLADAFNTSLAGLRAGKWRGEIYGDLRSKGFSEDIVKEILDKAEEQVGTETYKKWNRASLVISMSMTILVFLVATFLIGNNNAAATVVTHLLAGIIWLATNELDYPGIRKGIVFGWLAYCVVVLYVTWPL